MDPKQIHTSSSQLIQQRRQKCLFLKKNYPLSQMVLGKLAIHIVKTETRYLFLTLNKNQLKVDQRPYCKIRKSGITRGKPRGKTSGYWHKQQFPT
jgi:hypothetical protein